MPPSHFALKRNEMVEEKRKKEGATFGKRGIVQEKYIQAKEPESKECKSPQKLGEMLSIRKFSNIMQRSPKAEQV